jgi:hypothetical protein
MTGGLIFFLVLTIIYFTIKYYVTTPSTTNLISGAYYLLVIGFMFYVNSNTIKATCGTQNTGTALLYTPPSATWPPGSPGSATSS